MSKTAAQLKQLLSLGENQTLEYLTSCDLKHCGPQVCAFKYPRRLPAMWSR